MSALVKFEGWDLDTTGDEPRVRDIDIAVHAGVAEPANVRRVIDRNWEILSSFGDIRVVALGAKTSGGRPGREYWLNEEQAVSLTSMLKTKRARQLHVVLVKLFVAYRRGQLVATTTAHAPIQARIGDDPRERARLKALVVAASKASGISVQRIHGQIRKPWGVASIYRIALSSLDHTIAIVLRIIEAPPVRRLPADRRQLDMWRTN